MQATELHRTPPGRRPITTHSVGHRRVAAGKSPGPRRSAATSIAAVLTGVLALTLFVPAAAQIPGDLVWTPVASGFTSPVAIRHAGDGSGRLFVVEQDGVIQVMEDGIVAPTPFLDINGLVASGGELGLLGLAFHPDYSNNGLFYVNYTRAAGQGHETVVARYSVSAGDPDVADAGSASILLVVPQPFANHNGGDMHFGPLDGYLYIGLGDGGDFGTAQDLTSLLGKVLRIDVDGGTPYAIPPDNPYVGTATLRDEIWASGLRNPWRWSIDRQTGDLFFGDVGESEWEEMSFAEVGAGGLNFGWPCREGNHDFLPEFCDGSEIFTEPFFEVSHATNACSIIGGYVYRGSAIPGLVGYILFHDWCSGESWFARRTAPEVWEITPWNPLAGFNSVGYGEDEAGEIYVTSGDVILRLESPSAANALFVDGFESGTTDGWSAAIP